MHSTLTTRLLTLATALLLPVSLAAQQIAQPQIPQPAATATAPAPVPVTTAPAAPSPDDDVVELSPFVVQGETDDSYTALTTASGSRIKTDLRDTAASISPFTAQFLQDIGATTIEDMLSYGANIEAHTEDDGFGFENSAEVNTALGRTNSFRIRGMGMSTSVDFVESSIPQDLYNIDRAEVSSGPNSILFGTGAAGGMVTLTSKRANLQRNTLKIRNEYRTSNSPAVNGFIFRRNDADYNLVLIPKLLSLRLMALYQEGDNSSWKKWQHVRERRITPAVTFRPWRNTTVTVLYEAGRRKEPVSYALNASDQLTGWLFASKPTHGAVADRPIVSIFNGPNITNVYAAINGARNEPYIVLVDNNNGLYDARQTKMTRGGIMSGAGTQAEVRLDPKLSPVFWSVSGPDAFRDRSFDRYQFVIDQRLGGANLQLGYYHNKVTAVAHGPTTWDIALRGDPNLYISTVEWNPNGASVVDNPNINPETGGLYMEDNWGFRKGMSRNDVLRLSAEYTLNLKQFGRHRLIANLEHSIQENLKANYQEIIVDQYGRALLHADYPVGKNPYLMPAYTGTPPRNYGNSLWRRHYVTEGDFSTYHASSWQTPMREYTLGGRTFHSTYAFDNTDYPHHTKRRIDSITAAVQSYWFKDRVVTILGGRIDHVTLRRESFMSLIDDPNDPRLLTREKVWHEQYFDGHWSKAPVNTPFTFNAGVVWHVLDNISLHANTSSNRAAPADGAYYVLPGKAPTDAAPWSALPTNAEPPQRVGSTREAGMLINFAGPRNVTLRLTWFDTRSRHDTIGQNSNQVKASANNLQDIYTAFYEAGLMTLEQFQQIPGCASETDNRTTYSVGLRDSSSRGFEAELTSKPTKNLTLRLTASYSTRINNHLQKDIVAFFNNNIPVWMRLANPTLNGGYDYMLPSGKTLYEVILNEIYGASGIRDQLNSQAQSQGFASGARPLKFNLTARYNFPWNSTLKGLAFGGGVRYSDRVRMAPARLVLSQVDTVKPEDNPMDLHYNPEVYTDQSLMMKGSSLLFYDAFVTYKRKLFRGRTTMTLQVNIRNLFNTNILTQGQFRSTADTGTTYLRRIYLNPPRSINYTATFDF